MKLFWAAFWGPIWRPFCEPDLSLVRFSMLESVPEHLKAGGSYERLFQERPKEFRLGSTGVDCGRLGGGTLKARLTGAQLPPPGPSPSTEKERKRVDVYTRKYTLESIH